MSMKKTIMKIGGLVASLALMITAMTVNSACIFIIHQEKLPENSKKLRKF